MKKDLNKDFYKLYQRLYISNSKMAGTSYYTIFTLRALRPLDCKRLFEEADSADNPALAKSVGPRVSAP